MNTPENDSTRAVTVMIQNEEAAARLLPEAPGKTTNDSRSTCPKQDQQEKQVTYAPVPLPELKRKRSVEDHRLTDEDPQVYVSHSLCDCDGKSYSKHKRLTVALD